MNVTTGLTAPHPMQEGCDHFIPGLRSQPWWNDCEFPFVSELEANWELIAGELFDLMLSGSLRLHPQCFGGPRTQIADGDWNIFELWSFGLLNERNAIEAPRTVKLLASIPELRGHPRGLIYFSILNPHVHVSPHCGPTNSRIRIHLGLKVPEGATIRVGTETRSWKEGKCLIFDDSWEHEAHNPSDSYRAVLLMDAWHPDITQNQREKLLRNRKPADQLKCRRREGWSRYS